MGIQKNNFRFPIKSKYLEFLPKIKEKKIQEVTAVSLTFLGITVLGFFAISPTLSTIARLRKSLSDNITLYEKLTEKNSNLSILQQKYNSIEKDIPVVLSALPQTPQAAVLLAQIQALFQTHRLTLLNIGASEVDLSKGEEGNNQYSSFVFNFNAEGSYEDILQFINSSISFERIITINSISIVKSTKKTGSQITVIGKAYFKK